MRAAQSFLAFAFAFLAAYFLSTVLPTPLFWYYPLQHRFDEAGLTRFMEHCRAAAGLSHR